MEKGHCCRCPIFHLRTSPRRNRNKITTEPRSQYRYKAASSPKMLTEVHCMQQLPPDRVIHQSTTSRDTLWRQMSQISSRPGPAQHILAASVRMPFSAFRGGAQEFALGATLVACSPCGCSVVPVRSFALQQRERWTSQANLPIIRAGDMFMYRVKAPA